MSGSTILWIVIIGGLFFWMMRRGHGSHGVMGQGGQGGPPGFGGGTGPGGSQMVKDPVCGTFVDPKTSPVSSWHMGQTFYFCAPACKENFDKEPMKYMPKEQPREQPKRRGGCC